MNFLWPASLLLLIAIPLMVLAYVLIQRRRKKAVVRYSSLSLVREAKPQYSRIKRYLPFALFLLAIGSLVFALARPVSIVSVPVNSTTIMLAMDVSRSMCSTDIQPNRLEAAKDAAIAFIQSQKAGTRFGLVAFAGYAELIQTPITDLDTLKGAIESLSTGRRTAIGSGILKSIDAIAEADPSVVKSTRLEAGDVPPDPLPKGAYVPHIIVLLTDGASNAGPQPVDAAQQAADRGIRVACPDRGLGGWPFRLEVVCREAGIDLAGDGVVASVATLRVVAQIWDPHLVVVELDGPLVAERRDGPHLAGNWRRLRASLRWSTAGIERLSLAADDLDLAATLPDRPNATLRAAHLEAHARPSGDAGRDLDLAVSSAAAALRLADRPIGPEHSDLDLAVTLHGALPPGPGDAVAAFARRDGRITPIVGRFAVAGITVQAKGDLVLRPDGLLDGTIGLAARGLETLAVAAPTLGSETAGLLGAFVLLGKPSTDPELPGRRLDLIVDAGRPRFGRIVMPQMAPLFRP